MSVITKSIWTVCGDCGSVLDDVRKRRCSTTICWTSPHPSTSPPPQCTPAVGINCLYVHTSKVRVCFGTLTRCDGLPGASACLGGPNCGWSRPELVHLPQSPAAPDSRPPPVPASRTSAPFPQHDTPAVALPIQYRASLHIDCVHRRSGGRRATVPLLHRASVCILQSRQLHRRLVLEH